MTDNINDIARQFPVVTIGIPTYNRSQSLARAIESVANQTYHNLEIIISDNASSDATEFICKHFAGADQRIRYIRQPVNRGATANFNEVLGKATGTFFMWLGDDDWLEPDYVSICVKELLADPSLSLVSGQPVYFHNNLRIYSGNVFELKQPSGWLRVMAYYAKVRDNGMCYGIMRTTQIQGIKMQHTLAGDWLYIAYIAFLGTIKMMRTTIVHRSVAGCSANRYNYILTMGYPKYQAYFPYLHISFVAARDIWTGVYSFNKLGRLARLIFGLAVFWEILIVKGFVRSVLARSLRMIIGENRYKKMTRAIFDVPSENNTQR